RLITRLIAIVPAVLVIGLAGESKTTELLVASQVVLSMQLGFAVWPLMRFTSERAKLGEFTNKLWLKILGWTTTLIIITLNVNPNEEVGKFGCERTPSVDFPSSFLRHSPSVIHHY
ncbi:MAG: hypothetical protein DME32_17465, partial [Verrucomicrobia bacterium]